MYIVTKCGNNTIWRCKLNMKKLFPDEKKSRKSLLEFLDKKGFYIVLILCIAVVGATAVFVTTSNITSPEQDYSAEKLIPEESDDNYVVNVEGEADDQALAEVAEVPSENEVTVAPASSTKAAQSEGSTPKPEPKKEEKAPAAPAKSAAPVKDAAPAKGATPAKPDSSEKAQNEQFIMPVMGGVSFAFAQDKLVYSKTLEEWRTHSGIDLAAERGTPVKAVSKGVVTDIKNDPRFGITVVIDHENGLKTVYSNLASDDMVSPNQKVSQGDIIGAVGNTAAFESAEQPHLHFEVLKDDKAVNPEDYLPIKKL
jgi:murein DD-endopeptidase MepM/ murein hydrolase activator NlpD